MTNDFRVRDNNSKFIRFLVHRLNENRDVKIIVTGKNAATGIGKTTGAIQLADVIHTIKKCQNCNSFTYPRTKFCHRCNSPNLENQMNHSEEYPWVPENAGFMQPWEYINYYTNDSKPGEVLILDEAEYSIHKRRHQTNENVEMSKVWAALRYRNNPSILTLPSTSMIDSLMMELGDIWLNASKKGVFDIWWYHYDDLTQNVKPYRLINEKGFMETFVFRDLKNDYRKDWFDNKKESFTQGNQKNRFEQEDIEKAVKNKTHDQKVKFCIKLLRETELGQEKIGTLCHPEDGEQMSQGWVSQVNNNKLNATKDIDENFPIRAKA